MASPTLPSDIITDILSRLPSKTLIRFKSVCKQWYSLINSPSFVNLHLTQTLISQNIPNLIITQTLFSYDSPNLTISQCSLSSVAISDENNPNFHLIELDHPLKHLCDYRKRLPQILGSINGIVCISLNDKSSVVLYNPSTKTHRFIPPFTPSPNPIPLVGIIRGGGHVIHDVVVEGGHVNNDVFGFGFDSVRGDYKVLRIIERGNLTGVVYREASVYSLKNDSWKCVDNQTMMGQFIFEKCTGEFVNEVLHFTVADTKFNPKIKCFNLQTETFSTFDLPINDKLSTRKHLFIKDLSGCLGVLVNYQFGMSGIYTLLLAELWVMKEYGNEESWFRLFSICDPTGLDVSTQVRPVVYSRDKERFLLELDNLSYGWYSLGSNSFEKITVHGGPSGCATYETWTFVDSLVSIVKDKDKDMSKAKSVPKKIKNKNDFLSSGFKLRL